MLWVENQECVGRWHGESAEVWSAIAFLNKAQQALLCSTVYFPSWVRTHCNRHIISPHSFLAPLFNYLGHLCIRAVFTTIFQTNILPEECNGQVL